MKQYLDAIKHVLEHGTRKPNRTGVDTLSTFNYNYEIDLREGFPLLTTKEISWKNIVVENLWFLSGDTHIGLLQKHKCKFWDPWADEHGKVPSAYGNFWRHFPVHDASGCAALPPPMSHALRVKNPTKSTAATARSLNAGDGSSRRERRSRKGTSAQMAKSTETTASAAWGPSIPAMCGGNSFRSW